MDSSAFLIDHPSLAFTMTDAAQRDEGQDTVPMPAGVALDDAPLAVTLKDLAAAPGTGQGFAEFMDSISVPDDSRRNALSVLVRSHRSALTDLSRAQRELMQCRAREQAAAIELADAVELGGLLAWSLALGDRSLEVGLPLASLFGWPTEPGVRHSMSDLIDRVVADDRERFRAMLMSVLRRGVVERGDVAMLDRDGAARTMRLRLKPIVDDAARPVGVRALMAELAEAGAAGSSVAGSVTVPATAAPAADDAPAGSDAPTDTLRVQDVVQALKHEAFHPVFQSIVDGLTGSRIGAESLVRWTHPQRGEVLPAEFLPILEDAGLEGQLSRMMLRQACRHAADWRQVAGEVVFVSVNLSTRQLGRSELVWDIIDALAAAGLPSDALMLEIADVAIARDPDVHGELIHYLKQTGVRIAVDNVGVEPGELRRLAGLPVDCIKVDRRLVATLGEGPAGARLRALIGFAGARGLELIAGGVENDAQREALLALGCRRMQGYLFSRPTGAAGFGLAPG